MAFILYDHGKKLGEISDWKMISHVPVYKNVLGKEVLSVPAKDEVTFVSPKPVDRKKSKLTVVENSKKEFVLEIKAVAGGTVITANIISQNKI